MLIISAIKGVGRPMRVPQTAASVPNAPLTTPTRSTVRKATGEFEKSFRRSIVTRVSGLGEAAVESAVGRMAKAEEDRARHEQRRGQRVARTDAELAGRDAEIGHHHIDGEDHAAALVGGALVKPAFDDHERAGEEEPGAGAKKDPRERDDEDAVQKDDDRGAGGRAGEGADMPDAADDDRRGQAAEHEAGRPAGADQAELGGGKTLRRAAERHQKASAAHSRRAGTPSRGGARERGRSDGPKDFRITCLDASRIVDQMGLNGNVATAP